MYTTNEYTVLLGQECEDVTIYPNKPFEAFEGDYIVSNFARIVNPDTKEVINLAPGSRIKGVGEVKKPKRKRKVVKDD